MKEHRICSSTSGMFFFTISQLMMSLSLCCPPLHIEKGSSGYMANKSWPSIPIWQIHFLVNLVSNNCNICCTQSLQEKQRIKLTCSWLHIKIKFYENNNSLNDIIMITLIFGALVLVPASRSLTHLQVSQNSGGPLVHCTGGLIFLLRFTTQLTQDGFEPRLPPLLGPDLTIES